MCQACLHRLVGWRGDDWGDVDAAHSQLAQKQRRNFEGNAHGHLACERVEKEIPFAELKPEPPTKDRLSRDDPSQRRRVPPPPMPERSHPRQRDDRLRGGDEEPEARWPRRERDEPQKSSSMVLLLVIGGVLVLCGVGETVGYLLWPRPTASFSGTVDLKGQANFDPPNNLPPKAGDPGGKDKEVIGLPLDSPVSTELRHGIIALSRA